MESKPIAWSFLLLIVSVMSLHRSSHANGDSSTPWPASALTNFLNNNPLGLLVVGFLVSFFFLVFLSIFIHQCVHCCFSTSTHVFASNADRRRLEVLEQCPLLVYSQVNNLRIGNSPLECAVCLSQFGETDIIRLLPKCNHVFHADCIQRWFISRLTCPVCRARIPPPDSAENADHNAEAGNESSNDNGEPPAAADSGIDQQQTDTVEDESPAAAIGMDEERGSGGSSSGPPIRSRTAAKRLARSHSTGHYLIMESEGVMDERYTLILPEHAREEIFGEKEKEKRRLRRCASSNDVVLRGEWSSKEGSENMEKWALLCDNMKLLKQNGTDQASSSSSGRPPV